MMLQSTSRNRAPDYQTVYDAVITSIADDQCIAPETLELRSTLEDVGYESTIELLQLAHLIERRLKLIGMGTHGRIEFLLGANDRNLLHSETIDRVIKRVYVKIHGWN